MDHPALRMLENDDPDISNSIANSGLQSCQIRGIISSARLCNPMSGGVQDGQV